MILYSLACEAGHSFQSWFRDSAAFDDQAGRGFVTCPACQSDKVVKAIMAPAVVGSRTAPLPGSDACPAEVGQDPARKDIIGGAPTLKESTPHQTLLDARGREIRALLRGMRDKVVSEGDDVGRRFATEARRIHDGEAPMRQIYGQASAAEAHALIEDGIVVLPMPILPDELN